MKEMRTVPRTPGLEELLFFALALGVFIGCAEKGESLSSADRVKFLGRWAGTYACPKFPSQPDTLIIATGKQELEFSITIHSGYLNPDVVIGKLTGADEITVPEQSMGGAAGTATITIADEVITYRQSGLGVTCTGLRYRKY